METCATRMAVPVLASCFPNVAPSLAPFAYQTLSNINPLSTWPPPTEPVDLRDHTELPYIRPQAVSSIPPRALLFAIDAPCPRSSPKPSRSLALPPLLPFTKCPHLLATNLIPAPNSNCHASAPRSLPGRYSVRRRLSCSAPRMRSGCASPWLWRCARVTTLAGEH